MKYLLLLSLLVLSLGSGISGQATGDPVSKVIDAKQLLRDVEILSAGRIIFPSVKTNDWAAVVHQVFCPSLHEERFPKSPCSVQRKH